MTTYVCLLPQAYPFPWDPSNARAILQWTIAQQLDHLIYGFELGPVDPP